MQTKFTYNFLQVSVYVYIEWQQVLHNNDQLGHSSNHSTSED